MAEKALLLFDSGTALSAISADRLPGFNGSRAITDVSIDSRKIRKGSMFIALKEKEQTVTNSFPMQLCPVLLHL